MRGDTWKGAAPAFYCCDSVATNGTGDEKPETRDATNGTETKTQQTEPEMETQQTEPEMEPQQTEPGMRAATKKLKL